MESQHRTEYTRAAMPKLAFYLLSIALFLPACGNEDARVAQQALGEPQEGYPGYSERLVLYYTNRLRTDPPAFNPEGDYAPTPPLAWNLELAKAARFHAEHIIEASCWCADHSSCCALGGTGDDVACAGPVTGCGAETSEARVARWSQSYSGENMAMGQTTAAEAVEGWTFSSGHWENINRPGNSQLGAGNHGTAWVQDFGSAGRAPVIGDGIHFAAGQSTTFGTTYYQPGTGGPQTALVIVEGQCHELQLAHGVAEHGAFETTLALGPGCHRYYFHFTDGDGVDHTYPSQGSFAVANNAPDCEFFITTRPADTCSPSGQTCLTGDTRHCYTGPFGTEDVGLCEAGVERCVGGTWDGTCRLQVVPEATDTCGDGLDTDCNGVVDDACAPSEDAGAHDAGFSTADAAVSAPPVGDAGRGKEEPELSCSSTSARPTVLIWPLLLVWGLRRRTKRME